MHITFTDFPKQPGVYRMLNAAGKVLYVGKAKNLNKRLASYSRARDLKTLTLLAQVKQVEVTCTTTENEALLLENHLIKQFKPRYNIILKDDKSYPYLLLSKHRYPRLSIFRGKYQAKGDYFGPFPRVRVMRKVFNWLQKIFQLRTCGDSYLCRRQRPCVQYQIKRCSAPCVGYISKSEYGRSVNFAKLFLAGKSSKLVKNLLHLMRQAAAARDYERAAQLRDQIADLQEIQKSGSKKILDQYLPSS